MTTSKASWSRDAVIYQVYVRSFAGSDGDGVGDLPGVTSRLDYLVGLGVDAEWLTPFYRSFGSRGSWLPQPDSWARLSVAVRQADASSTLSLYTRAAPAPGAARTNDLTSGAQTAPHGAGWLCCAGW